MLPLHQLSLTLWFKIVPCQFDRDKHLLHEHDGPNSPDKSSAMHAYVHPRVALGYICYTLAYT